MKIKSVETFVLESKLPVAFSYSQGVVPRRSTTLVRITTDDGIEGWGESFSVSLQPPQIAASIVDYALAPTLIGADAMATDVVWNEMYGRSRDYGRKGVVIGAISAVDIALWDIKGKALGKPVWALLGGAFRDRVQCYATGFFRARGRGESSAMAEEAQRHLDNGFEIMKVKLGFGLQDDLEVMNRVRDVVDGRARLMIDVNHAYGSSDAIRLGRALEDFDLLWYEEPVIPEDLAGYRRVRTSLAIPIAGGEAEFSMYGFRDLINAEAIDIAQPDICLAGGFTALKHIGAIAQANGIMLNPHVWGTAVGQYASLHASANTPSPQFGLYPSQPLFEYDTSSHPFRTELVTEPLEHKDGWLSLPQTPGLGITIDLDFVRRNSIRY
ncbi:mandelate racemase/muconate lactonizing enzyme family protein [Ensifer sp. MPMI2T]|nr:mandelate racemase/muconate lactonizing enzyme family protein [Ensifer sp. MPMI2T]